MHVQRRRKKLEGFGWDDPEVKLEGFGWDDPEVKLEGYGLIGCGQWSVLTDRLKLLLQQAEGLGLTGSAAYVSARQYYDDKVGWWKTAVLFGSHCEEETKEVNDRISALTAAIASTGSAPVVAGHAVEAPPAEDWGAMVKWVVGGVIAVAGAWTVVTIVPRIFKKKGYGSYSRRRRSR